MKINRMKLFAEMAKSDMNYTELAEKVGVHPETIRRIKNGYSCSDFTAARVAMVLGVPLSELLEEE